MPVRIYTLSQQLKIDSKDLVEICVKAGVTGKGSALASLTDAEVKKVTDYLASTKGGGKSAASSRPDTAPPATTIDRVVTRGDYIGPAGSSGKPPVLDSPPRKSPEVSPAPESSKPRPPQKREPVLKLAAIPPTSELPTVPSAPAEPAAQKPIMTLPKEAIRGAQQGVVAPLQQFTKQQERKRREAEPRRPEVPSVPLTPEEAEEVARGRDVKGRKREHRLDKDRLEDLETDRELAGMASARATRQQTRQKRPMPNELDEEATTAAPITRRLVRSHRPEPQRAIKKSHVLVDVPCTVRSFSEASGIPAARILKSLMSLGVTVPNFNAELDVHTAEMIALEQGIEVEFRAASSLEEEVLAKVAAREDDPQDLRTRPPIVTFLGHVDHGKTSLLDRIIGIDVVSGEAGGITQHIRAYNVEKDGKSVSFVDTPGHEAFTEMRLRGANVTDIAVLVVAADDGFMPQTIEALSHARAAGVPIVVALNKIDLPGVDVNRVLQDMAANSLLPVEWGGDTEVVRTSALTGQGIDDLLETLLLTAEIHEYRANPNRPATGTCLEAQQEGARGVVAKLIVQNGTLHVGDVIVCGQAYGRVKAMYDTLDPKRKRSSAGPSIPVNVTGLDVAPAAGEAFHVLQDITVARQIAEQRAQRSRTKALSGVRARISFEEFQRRLEEGRLDNRGDVATLNLIIRADVRGSIEAIQKELAKFEHPEVQIRTLLATVGGITVGDVTLADASHAVIVGFNVIPDENARALAEERGVEIRRYEIIYKLTEDIKHMIEGKLKPEEQIQELGRALVQRVFNISRVGAVAGCRVLAGTIERGCRIRLNRDGRGIGDYLLESLKREKDDAREVREGYECGIKLANFNDLKEGDVLEAYKILEVARTL